MTKKEYTERLQAIGTEADETARRELIAALIEDGGKDYDDHAAAVTARDNLQRDNETLRDANMKLFLRVGDPNKKADDPAANTEPKKMRFEDLFDEKGGIK